MPFDSNWLDALKKLPLRVTLGVALGSAVLLIFSLLGVLDLDLLSAFAKPLVIVICAVSGAFAAVGVIDFMTVPLREKRRQSALATRRAVRRKEQQEQLAQRREQVIARLDHLSERELSDVTDCLRSNSPTFYTWVHCPSASMLVAKGIAWTTNQIHQSDHYPYSIHDFVWVRLLERRNEFLARDDEHKRAAEAKEASRRRRRGY